MTEEAVPRVLMIAQWPAIKNAEYELIERVRRTGFPIAVVDFFGFDVRTGKCINGPTLRDEFDFAVSLHYETPKFLDLPTLYWVANPLEFPLAQGNYRTHLIHNLRSYDEYLYNGSDFLKEHIRTIVGEEWRDGGLSFFQSCSRKALLAPRAPGEPGGSAGKLFYCGVNWEAISDKDGRAQGLLEILQERGIADFYGPQSILGVNVWGGFTSYRGEIPFDGESMFPAMHAYDAVLALSSPAHIKSRTSSGRVLEGFAAGIPVISDENPHVRGQFGDLVYYFAGATEAKRADAIQAALEDIRSRPGKAVERVREAQALISDKYCFEVCLEQARDAIARTRLAPLPRTGAATGGETVVDVFLFFHDPYAPERAPSAPAFANLAHIASAMSWAASRGRVRFRLLHCQPLEAAHALGSADGVELVDLGEEVPGGEDWGRLRLGEKMSRLARRSKGDFAVFLTQSDFPQYDYFGKPLQWRDTTDGAVPAIHIGGFFVSDLSAPAPLNAGGILRCSASDGLYRWTQNSIAEHQLAQLCFNRPALERLDLQHLERFDVLLPLAAVLDGMARGIVIHRSRHVLLRVEHGHYHRYLDAFRRVSAKGLWAQHYELLSNANHEINALYDVFHESREVVAIADKILGIDIPPPAFTTPAPVDPAVLAVNNFLNRIAPYVVFVKKVGRAIGIR
jgi:hypothetical protein